MDLLEISNLEEELAKKYNSEGLVPFPYENIQKDKGDLDIFLTDFEGKDEVSGAISYDKNTKRFSILINKTKPKTRQNFTIAHEIGHYFLHQETIKSKEAIIDGDSFLDGGQVLYRLDTIDQSTIEVEREANNFAASLIMPKNLVEKVWNTFKDVEECARVFQVSVSAMSIRLERLKLIN